MTNDLEERRSRKNNEGCTETHRDRAVVFGEYQNLVGVLREPEERGSSLYGDADIAVIILTPGMLHSAGPFRLHHDLAKQLGENGILSLRFDLSGIGESLAVGSDCTSLERAASEIGEAIDFLTTEYGIKSVILFGLCSGADDALYAASNDTRIAGLIAVDGCGYRTGKYYASLWANKYLPKLKNPRKWLKLLSASLGSSATGPARLQLGTDLREFPSRDEAESQILALVQRGVLLHFHYTGGVSEYYNYQNQFADMFPRVASDVQADRATDGTLPGWPTWSFAPHSDHVAFLCEHRTELINLICRKVNEYYARLSNASATNIGNRGEETTDSQFESNDSDSEAAFPVLPISSLPATSLHVDT